MKDHMTDMEHDMNKTKMWQRQGQIMTIRCIVTEVHFSLIYDQVYSN